MAPIAVGLYTWVVSVTFGAVLLDVVYARQAVGADLSQAADFLLVVSAATIAAGVWAVSASWASRPARNLLLGSLAIGVLGFVGPALLATVVQDAPAGLGTGMRLAIHGLPCILAFLAFHRLLAERTASSA